MFTINIVYKQLSLVYEILTFPKGMKCKRFDKLKSDVYHALKLKSRSLDNNETNSYFDYFENIHQAFWNRENMIWGSELQVNRIKR